MVSLGHIPMNKKKNMQWKLGVYSGGLWTNVGIYTTRLRGWVYLSR